METSSTRRVGQYDVRIAFAPPSPEAKERWDRRGETLTRWLLHRWEAAQQEVRDANAKAS